MCAASDLRPGRRLKSTEWRRKINNFLSFLFSPSLGRWPGTEASWLAVLAAGQMLYISGERGLKGDLPMTTNTPGGIKGADHSELNMAASVFTM